MTRTGPGASRREMERDLVKHLRSVSRHQALWKTFSDWIEMCAITMSNAVDRNQAPKREARYREIAKRYEPADHEHFRAALQLVVQLLEAGPADVLGTVFMGQDLGSEARGQFFTPFEVSTLMARILHSDLVERARKEIITLNEPTCGSGGMVIAMAQSLLESGVNYQTQMHCVAQDIDHTAVHMAYVQLSLLYVPAVVIQGNTLLVEANEVWFTPAHVLGTWNAKLRQRDAEKQALEILRADTTPAAASASDQRVPPAGLVLPLPNRSDASAAGAAEAECSPVRRNRRRTA